MKCFKTETIAPHVFMYIFKGIDDYHASIIVSYMEIVGGMQNGKQRI